MPIEDYIQVRQNIHTAAPAKKLKMFEDLNNDENEEPTPNKNFRFRERINNKQNVSRLSSCANLILYSFTGK